MHLTFEFWLCIRQQLLCSNLICFFMHFRYYSHYINYLISISRPKHVHHQPIFLLFGINHKIERQKIDLRMESNLWIHFPVHLSEKFLRYTFSINCLNLQLNKKYVDICNQVINFWFLLIYDNRLKF